MIGFGSNTFLLIKAAHGGSCITLHNQEKCSLYHRNANGDSP